MLLDSSPDPSTASIIDTNTANTMDIYIHTLLLTINTITLATLQDNARNTTATSIYLSSVNWTRHATISASPSRQQVCFALPRIAHACCIYGVYVCVYVYLCMFVYVCVYVAVFITATTSMTTIIIENARCRRRRVTVAT